MTNTTTDLQARMEALVRRLANKGIPNNSYSIDLDEARAIVAELPKPIDPDVLAVREILGGWLFGCSCTHGLAESVVSGECDDGPAFWNALNRYKRIKSGGVA